MIRIALIILVVLIVFRIRAGCCPLYNKIKQGQNTQKKSPDSTRNAVNSNTTPTGSPFDPYFGQYEGSIIETASDEEEEETDETQNNTATTPAAVNKSFTLKTIEDNFVSFNPSYKNGVQLNEGTPVEVIGKLLTPASYLGIYKSPSNLSLNVNVEGNYYTIKFIMPKENTSIGIAYTPPEPVD